MAILFIHDESEDILAHYEEGIKQLEKVGFGHPPGRLYHVAARKDNGYLVVDVWNSQEDLDNFARTLMPILEGLGSPITPPQVYPAYNIIEGAG